MLMTKKNNNTDRDRCMNKKKQTEDTRHIDQKYSISSRSSSNLIGNNNNNGEFHHPLLLYTTLSSFLQYSWEKIHKLSVQLFVMGEKVVVAITKTNILLFVIEKIVVVAVVVVVVVVVVIIVLIVTVV